MFCEACGSALHEGAQFCGKCGHSVPGADAMTAATPPPATPPPAAPAVPAVAAAPVAVSGSGNPPWLIPTVIGAAVIAILALGAILLTSGGGGDGGGGGGEEVQLVSATASGPDPFTPPIAPEALPVTVTTAPGSGPFGGTGDNSLCDREQLVTFLTDPAHSTQAREFARVLGISVAQIPTYVRNLIPNTLASDTRVTNHTFQNGRAVGFQAVLQAGTAVLVDTYGKPVVRCRCGNPLLEPARVSSPTYVGPQWPGFNPTTIIIIQVSNTQIFPPGGGGTVSSSSTTTTRPNATGGGDEAIAILTNAIQECISQLGATQTTPLSYSAAPGAGPGVYAVTVTATASGEYGSWTVTVATGDITAADQLAAEIGAYCPALA